MFALLAPVAATSLITRKELDRLQAAMTIDDALKALEGKLPAAVSALFLDSRVGARDNRTAFLAMTVRGCARPSPPREASTRRGLS